MRETKEQLRAAFNEAYASLNAAQRQAVDTIDGPVMVIAGPGTGKTQILTLRIANILLQTDTAPESILALTFTESGAKAMRERLHRYIGSEAYRVAIYTFHGFADRLIRTYPDAFGRVIGGRPATDIEKISLLETILEDTSFKKLRPSGNPTYYVAPLLRIIADLKKEYVSPDGLRDLVATQETELMTVVQFHEKGPHKGKERGAYTKLKEQIEKNRELTAVYRQYEALLQERHLYDFDDMIIETVAAIRDHETLLYDLQEQYQYVLADEHQDVNGAQNKILELLTNYHESPNIFVVGDEKQAIYRFQGASLDNFLYFQDHYQNTTIINLTENYRSGQTILDAAHSLVAVEDGPLKKLRVPLVAKAVSSALVYQADFVHQAIEDEALVETISNLIAEGTPPEEIAVIVRTNREVESIADLLRKRTIAVTASADSDVLMHPITQAVEALMAAVLPDADEHALFTVLHGPYWGLTRPEVMRIMAARSYDTSLMTILGDAEKLQDIGIENIKAAQHIREVLETAQAREVTEPPHRVLQSLLKDSGFLDHVIAHDPFEGVRIIRRLYDEVEALVLRDGIGTLRAVLDIFTLHRTYGIALNAPYIATNSHAVQVMTAHKSKGLEFNVVFVPHLQDANWGGSTKRTYFNIPLPQKVRADIDEVIDDERRLLYVAMTRARFELRLSFAAQNTDGKVLIPSRLYDAIDQGTLTHLDTQALHQAYEPIASLMSVETASALDVSFLLQSLATRGFSATSLNNYLKNPFDYLYRNVLRIPEVQPAHMQFGTAIHNVLESVTKHHTTHGTFPTDTSVKEKLERELGRLPVGRHEFVRILEKGMDVLYPYLAHLASRLPTVTKEELQLRVVLSTGIPELPELPLTGKLDRLDINENGNAVRVVDYKTGKPKSRNEIEGKTASGDGGYKRQLVFYTLLLSLYDDDRYKTNEGVLSFVEPDKKGIIHEESFTITDEDVVLLREEIIAAAAAIVRGDFLDDHAAAAASEYAPLATQLFV